jgi:hypothetical protein
MSSGPASARNTHPLTGAFPLTVMALAAFLVVFTLMMARLTSAPGTGSGPAPGASAATVFASGRPAIVSSRSSGAAASTAPAPGGASSTVVASGAQASSTPAILATRSSGAGLAEGGRDD